MVSQVSRIFVVLAVIGVGLLSFGKSEAGGSSTNLRFEAIPSIRTDAGTWPDTTLFLRSTSTLQLVRGTWFRPGTTASSGQVTVGPAPTSVTLSGDPSYLWYATGSWLSYPQGTGNAFVSTQWYSTVGGCDAPRMTISARNPFTTEARAKAIIDNSRGRLPLFVSENNGPWTELPIGDFYSANSRETSEIRIATDMAGESLCARANWNVTLDWILGPAPKITNVTPTTAKPGDRVVITGRDFLSTATTNLGTLKVILAHPDGGVATLAVVVGYDNDPRVAKAEWDQDQITFTLGQIPDQSGSLSVLAGNRFDTWKDEFTVRTTPGIELNRASVAVTLNRSKAKNNIVSGQGFKITSKGATAFEIKYNEPTQGQGFTVSSGGITNGQTVEIGTYVSANKPNGVYKGSAVVRYYQNGVWKDGPTVYYRIRLIGKQQSSTTK